jgi:hypothetical protein
MNDVEKPIVYIVHQPSRFDKIKKKMISINLKGADAYGDLLFIFPGNERPPCLPEALPIMRSVLSGFRACDYLVIVGDFDLYTWAAVLALRATGGTLKLLKWNNRKKVYDVCAAPVGLLAD